MGLFLNFYQEEFDIDKYIKERKRLNLAMNGRLDEALTDLLAIFQKYNIDMMPSFTYELCLFAVQNFQLKRVKLPRECQCQYDFTSME